MSGNSFKHTTVLLDELVSALNLKEGYTAIDCTAGGGGHLALMLQKCGRKGKVYGVDRDPEAIRVLSDRFQPERANGQLELLHGPFSEMIESISGEPETL